MTSQPVFSVGFLLGSGVSLPAAPGTQVLTDLVLNEIDKFYIHTDEEWYRLPSQKVTISPAARARQKRAARLIKNLAARVERYYGERTAPHGCPVRWCNYEDIGYLADALAATLNRNRDDPGLMPLAEDIRRQLRFSIESLLQASEDTVAFVRAVVFMGLIDAHPPDNHLRLVLDAAVDTDVGQLPIYTLNHDCLLEDTFDAAGIKFFDFRRPDSDRVLLDLDAPIPDEARAVLYKPHGSVRWRRFRPLKTDDDVDPWFTEWVGWHRDEAGNRHDDGENWRSIGLPLILVGRFNKELDYTGVPYWQTFLALARSFDTRRQLVISGYGFGDKAINTLLINWLYAKPVGERRVIVMHNDKAQLLDGARGSIRQKWDDWAARGQLQWIPHFPCDYTWQQLKDVLATTPRMPARSTG